MATFRLHLYCNTVEVGSQRVTLICTVEMGWYNNSIENLILLACLNNKHTRATGKPKESLDGYSSRNSDVLASVH